MGHVRKIATRGGRPRFQARYIDPTGKERAKNFTTRAEARDFVIAIESSKLKGEWLVPELGRKTFEEWALRVESSRINLRENPRLRDAWVLKDLILPTFGQLPIASIDDHLVQGWVKQLSEDGYAASTVKKAYQTLARILGAAVGKWISRSPCLEIAMPAEDDRRMRILNDTRFSRWRTQCLTATGCSS